MAQCNSQIELGNLHGKQIISGDINWRGGVLVPEYSAACILGSYRPPAANCNSTDP